jgi:putative ABC transport system permease protein
MIINETAAKALWPGENPVGKRLRPVGQNWAEIVGVVGDIKYDGLSEPPSMHVYQPDLQIPWPVLRVSVRSRLKQANIVAAVGQATQALDPDQPISNVKTMRELLEDSMGARRAAMSLFGLFAVAALLLTSIGVYGVVANSVSQRTREIGVRMAVGAQTGDILRLVLRQGARLILPGLGFGLALALALTPLLKSLLFGVGAADPMTFALIALSLSLVVALACWIPARRATKVDPMVAMRGD